MDGVVKLVFPEAKGDPPVAAAYQSTVFPPATVAVKVTVPAEVLDAPFDPVMVGKAAIVIDLETVNVQLLLTKV
jgi:hypothetical protein